MKANAARTPVDATSGMQEPEGMNQDIELAIIGCGNMGGAILDGMIAADGFPVERILVVERSAEIRSRCEQTGIPATEALADAREAKRILLAVKPQMFHEVAEGLGTLPRPTLVMSVMAGLSSKAIRKPLGEHARVVRTMPNTPCRIHAGITAVAPGIGATDEDLEQTEEILATVGEVVRVREEEMYAVTAISGSGPAYVFLLTEAWIDAAINQGIDRATAERLVRGTLQGATALVAGEEDPKALRAAVTSKGGTTAAAIAALEERFFRDAMNEAIEAATRRGIELDSEVAS